VLARDTQVNQTYLVDHLAQSSARYRHAVAATTAALTARGIPGPSAFQQALATVAQGVQNQATLLAYIDVFADLALIALVLAPVAFLLLRGGPTGAAAH